MSDYSVRRSEAERRAKQDLNDAIRLIVLVIVAGTLIYFFGG